MRLALICLIAAGMCGAMVEGDAISPDGKAEITCDLPVELRLKNTGGIGPRGPGTGSGLCVFTAIELCGRYQNVAALVGFQQKMTREPGGGHPQKVTQMMQRYCPGVDYLQHTAGDVAWLRAALRTGRPVATTYCGHDPRYGNQTIAHMVNLNHLDDERAAIVDNNFPGKVLWMTAQEFTERWRGVNAAGKPFTIRDQFGRSVPVGGGWAIVVLDPPPPPTPNVRS